MRFIFEANKELFFTIVVCSEKDPHFASMPILPSEHEAFMDIMQYTGKMFADRIDDIYGFMIVWGVGIDKEEDEGTSADMMMIVAKDIDGDVRGHFKKFGISNKKVVWLEDENLEEFNKKGWVPHNPKNIEDRIKLPLLEELWQAYKFNKIILNGKKKTKQRGRNSRV